MKTAKRPTVNLTTWVVTFLRAFCDLCGGKNPTPDPLIPDDWSLKWIKPLLLIKEFGLNTREEYMAEAFSRNIGLLTQAEQDKLANATVAIPRMGGVGGALKNGVGGHFQLPQQTEDNNT